LATEDEKKTGIVLPEMSNRTPPELQRRLGGQYADLARVGGRAKR